MLIVVFFFIFFEYVYGFSVIYFAIYFGWIYFRILDMQKKAVLQFWLISICLVISFSSRFLLTFYKSNVLHVAVERVCITFIEWESDIRVAFLNFVRDFVNILWFGF